MTVFKLKDTHWRGGQASVTAGDSGGGSGSFTEAIFKLQA